MSKKAFEKKMLRSMVHCKPRDRNFHEDSLIGMKCNLNLRESMYYMDLCTERKCAMKNLHKLSCLDKKINIDSNIENNHSGKQCIKLTSYISNTQASIFNRSRDPHQGNIDQGISKHSCFHMYSSSNLSCMKFGIGTIPA
jgi:hypothetical protein